MRVPLGPGGGSISAVVKVVRVMITMECSEEETLCCYMFSLSMKGAKHAIGLMMIDGDPARLDRPDLYAELLPPSVIRSPSLHNVEDDEALPGLGLSNPRRWNQRHSRSPRHAPTADVFLTAPLGILKVL